MAAIDDLVSRVSDPQLRKDLERAVAQLKGEKKFGLVFEQHLPETLALPGLPLKVGQRAVRRDDPEGTAVYRIDALPEGDNAMVTPEGGGEPLAVPKATLMAVTRFGEPIYPVLTPLGTVERGPQDRPHHAVINGENYHALQLLRYLYVDKVDCVYLDPPYNTGAKDWKYNNRFVDENDQWRHSKWLSMMERRLRLVKPLLKPDGVLIVTIDEHEVNHLGLLLEKLFPTHSIQMVNIVMNPKGTGKKNFARVDECAFFCVPNLGRLLISGVPTNVGKGMATAPIVVQPDLLKERNEESELDEILTNEEDEGEDEGEGEESELDETDDFAPDDISEWEKRHARRRGGESSYRHQRPDQFYPIYVDAERMRVVRIGEPIGRDETPSFDMVDGLQPIWPIDREDNHRVWRLVNTSMRTLLKEKRIAVGQYNETQNTFTLNLWVRRAKSKKLKTVWWDKLHDAGTHGTTLLHNVLGRRNAFPFPKSVYAVRDCIAAVVRDRPEAIVLDVFAGSGTTLHATCLLNSEDGGARRSVMVSNNELDAKTANQLQKRGSMVGDEAYDKEGIYYRATAPRSKAIVTGKRPDGAPIKGKYASGREMSKGFEENVSFFRIDYLDPDAVETGRQLRAILPALWLAAGGVGEIGPVADDAAWVMPESSTFAVLLNEARVGAFMQALKAREEVTHVWFVTNSEEHFAEMRAELKGRRKAGMLVRDYLRNFRIDDGMGSAA